MSSDKKDTSELAEFPEVVSFTGVGRAPLKHIHLIALSLVILGVIFAIVVPPSGYIVLVTFIVIAAGYDFFFLKRSQKPIRISLYLRTDPVEAILGENKIGEIRTGTIQTKMESYTELGYRPAPNKDLMVWKFDSEENAKIVAKRLLLYLPKEES